MYMCIIVFQLNIYECKSLFQGLILKPFFSMLEDRQPDFDDCEEVPPPEVMITR